MYSFTIVNVDKMELVSDFVAPKATLKLSEIAEEVLNHNDMVLLPNTLYRVIIRTLSGDDWMELYSSFCFETDETGDVGCILQRGRLETIYTIDLFTRDTDV